MPKLVAPLVQYCLHCGHVVQPRIVTCPNCRSEPGRTSAELMMQRNFFWTIPPRSELQNLGRRILHFAAEYTY